jgi:hypothetical protein
MVCVSVERVLPQRREDAKIRRCWYLCKRAQRLVFPLKGFYRKD